MTLLGVNTALTQDQRCNYANGAGAIVADANFASGWCASAVASSTAGGQGIGISSSEAAVLGDGTGGTITDAWASADAYLNLAQTGTGTGWYASIGDDSLEDSDINPPKKPGLYVRGVGAGGQLTLSLDLVDTAGTTIASAEGQTYVWLQGGPAQQFELHLQWLSATSVRGHLRLNGTVVLTGTFTVVAGNGAILCRTFNTGVMYLGTGWSKGAQVITRWDRAFLVDSRGADAHFAGYPRDGGLKIYTPTLPTADRLPLATYAQWVTDAATQGTFSRWDDAFGTSGGGDTTYNEAGTAQVAGALQESAYPGPVTGAQDVVGVVTLAGLFLLAVGGAPADCSLVIDDGSAAFRTAIFEAAMTGTSTIEGHGQQHWTQRPSTGTWGTNPNLSGLFAGARRAGTATDWRAYALYMTAGYYSAAPPPPTQGPGNKANRRRPRFSARWQPGAGAGYPYQRPHLIP